MNQNEKMGGIHIIWTRGVLGLWISITVLLLGGLLLFSRDSRIQEQQGQMAEASKLANQEIADRNMSSFSRRYDQFKELKKQLNPLRMRTRFIAIGMCIAWVLLSGSIWQVTRIPVSKVESRARWCCVLIPFVVLMMTASRIQNLASDLFVGVMFFIVYGGIHAAISKICALAVFPFFELWISRVSLCLGLLVLFRAFHEIFFESMGIPAALLGVVRYVTIGLCLSLSGLLFGLWWNLHGLSLVRIRILEFCLRGMMQRTPQTTVAEGNTDH